MGDAGAYTELDLATGSITQGYGGGYGGGISWADNPHGRMTKLYAAGGRFFDRVEYWTGGRHYRHGGNGGSQRNFDLRDVCINQVLVGAKGYVDSLTFVGYHISNPRRGWRSPRIGGGGGDKHTVNLDGCLNGFHGRSYGWMDKIGFYSSKEITKLRGHWRLDQSKTGTIDQQFEERVIKTSSSYVDKQESKSYSLTVGFEAEFFGVGVSSEASTSSSSFLQQTFSDFQSRDTFVKERPHCPALRGYRTQIWQFEMMANGNDGKTIKVETPSYVCPHPNKPAPRCTPDKCIDAECTRCR